MMPSAELRVVFRLAAGPRRGFGHLVRSLSFARALGVRPLLSLRGGPRIVEAALALGGEVLADSSPRALRRMRPDVVVVDDPVARQAQQWIESARRVGAVVVSIHDLGLGCLDADVVIDGSITNQARPRPGRVGLRGSRFAILDEAVTATARRRRPGTGHGVLVALGGGPRRRMARAIAEAIVQADPRAHVRIAGGFVADEAEPSARVTWVTPSRGLSRELARASVAVVGGGVSLYEACAAGVPAVGVPVVAAQRPTVNAFARRGAALRVPFRSPESHAAAQVVSLLNDPRRCAVLRARSMQLVDGKGAARAAAAVLTFVKGTRA